MFTNFVSAVNNLAAGAGFGLSVPYTHTISPPLTNGSQIHVSGTPYGNRFEINLKSYQDEVILHVNPRFDDNALVLNSARRGSWAQEERHGLNFYRGVRFNMVIMASDRGFKIAVNNMHLCEFNHRYPIHSAQILEIKGELNLESAQVYPGSSPFSISTPMGFNISTGFAPAPPQPSFHVDFNPGFGFPSAPPVTITTTPMMGSAIPSIQPCRITTGSRIFVRGFVPMHAHRFELNFLQGYSDTDDIAFHFNPRFDSRTIVKNHRRNGAWGSEENQAFPSFVPLSPGSAVDLQITCNHDRYTVYMNNILIAEYHHKIPPGYVMAVQYKGDIQVTSVGLM